MATTKGNSKQSITRKGQTFISGQNNVNPYWINTLYDCLENYPDMPSNVRFAIERTIEHGDYFCAEDYGIMNAWFFKEKIRVR